VCDEVLKALGLERGRIAALREIPVAKILDAQRIAMMALARPGDATPPYRMVRDGAALKRDPLDAVAAGSAAGKDILIGTTRDEMHAFFAGNEQLTALGRAGIVNLLRKQSGDAAEQTFNAYATRSPGQSPVEIFSAIRTDTFFRLPSLRFAEAQGRHASTTYVYRFDWRPVRDAPFGAAHCIELPFVFDNLADWDAAAVPPAMLKGGDRRVMAKLADAMQKAWVAFAAGGNPNHPGLPRWQPYSATRRHSMVFDAECRAAENLDDASDTTRTA
jgi:para-nitrobenzyl esterase